MFALSGWLKVSRWDSTLALFENEYHVPLLAPHTAAVLGTVAELMLPLLFVLGIRTRAVAIALFVFNIVAVISYPDLSDAGMKDHVLWGALMLVVAIYGPGRFSVDRWLSR
ncbi:MAG TPA: DoxX family protein [Casimicrobiaceae bacterium]|nr:DoxX family protein [Casimicrobiaceae bacterium]